MYEGAVYMHQGKTYLVKEVDISEKIAFCQEANFQYYTKTRDYTDIHVLGGDIVRQALYFVLFFLCFSMVHISNKFPGFQPAVALFK